MVTRATGVANETHTRPAAQHYRIALVLQGGGALGAYQAGVYEALEEHGCAPDWIVGTSIGAINGAIIAGNVRNARLTRLRDYWRTVSRASFLPVRGPRSRNAGSRDIVMRHARSSIPLGSSQRGGTRA